MRSSNPAADQIYFTVNRRTFVEFRKLVTFLEQRAGYSAVHMAIQGDDYLVLSCHDWQSLLPASTAKPWHLAPTERTSTAAIFVCFSAQGVSGGIDSSRGDTFARP